MWGLSWLEEGEEYSGEVHRPDVRWDGMVIMGMNELGCFDLSCSFLLCRLRVDLFCLDKVVRYLSVAGEKVSLGHLSWIAEVNGCPSM